MAHVRHPSKYSTDTQYSKGVDFEFDQHTNQNDGRR